MSRSEGGIVYKKRIVTKRCGVAICRMERWIPFPSKNPSMVEPRFDHVGCSNVSRMGVFSAYTSSAERSSSPMMTLKATAIFGTVHLTPTSTVLWIYRFGGKRLKLLCFTPIVETLCGGWPTIACCYLLAELVQESGKMRASGFWLNHRCWCFAVA